VTAGGATAEKKKEGRSLSRVRAPLRKRLSPRAEETILAIWRRDLGKKGPPPPPFWAGGGGGKKKKKKEGKELNVVLYAGWCERAARVGWPS